MPRVWRCDGAVPACKSRDFGAVLVRDARKTIEKRARDRHARAAKFARDRRKFCASAPQLCRAFGAATAQFWRANWTRYFYGDVIFAELSLASLLTLVILEF